MWRLFLALIAATAILVHSPASALTTSTTGMTQTTPSLSVPVLVGKPSKDFSTRHLRIRHMKDDKVGDSEKNEERLIKTFESWVRYKLLQLHPKFRQVKLHPGRVFTLLGLDGLHEMAIHHPGWKRYVDYSQKWRSNNRLKRF